MPAFSVIAFNGSAIKVWARDEAWMIGTLSGTYHHGYVRIEANLTPADYAFIMPREVQALHDQLRELAGIPQLRQMVRGQDYTHAVHGTVTFIASDPHDGAYLICKYWDNEKDEQAYFGCEASDLRWL